jgi:hypothetical protein
VLHVLRSGGAGLGGIPGGDGLLDAAHLDHVEQGLDRFLGQAIRTRGDRSGLRT